MAADAGLQVWIEAAANPPPAIIVPHVRSAAPRTVQFRIVTVREARGNRSTLGQGGTVTLPPGQAVALARIVLAGERGQSCRIEVVLTEAGRPLHDQSYACPGG